MSVTAQYELLRKKLIDTGLRNRMLNYKLSRASGVTVEGEDPDQIFQMIVVDPKNKRMLFTGQPDDEKTVSPDADQDVALEIDLFDLPEAETKKVDQTDNKLNTPHKNKVLSRRLLKTSRDAQELYEETGINVLYLALGGLNWRPANDAQKECVAPLIFVPVTLERDNNGRFGIRYSGDDLGDNLSLRVKLKEEFGIDLPFFQEDQSIADYAAQVAKACKAKADWSVDPTMVVLGFFQFTKLVMYEDLKLEAWSDQQKPILHRDLVAVLGEGYGTSEATISEDQNIDDIRPPAECKEIYSSDSSQALAMMRALEGRSMVIEGPPGTGKSQTIANLIAEYVAQGKKVLFVSEKMAALDVVFRRLDQAGLSDSCLELHSRASRRKGFYEELRRIMGLRGQLQSADAEINRLAVLRSRLNDYSKAVNEPLLPWELTPHEAIGLASSLPLETEEDIPHRVPFDKISDLSYDDFKGKLPIISSFEALLGQIGVPKNHPFYECGIRVITPGVNLELQSELSQAVSLLSDGREKANALTDRLCLSPLVTPADMPVIARCVKRAIDAPPVDGVAVKLDSWQSEHPTILDCIAQLRQLRELKNKHQANVLPSIWTTNLAAIISTLEQWAPKWFKFVSGEYKLRFKELQAHLTNPSISPIDALLIAKDVAVAQSCERKIEGFSTTMSRLFGAQWQGSHTDPDVLQRLTDWCLELKTAVQGGVVPPGLLDFFSANHSDTNLQAQASDAEVTLSRAISSCKSIAGKLLFSTEFFDSQSLSDSQSKVESWQNNLSRIAEITQYNTQVEEIRKHGLDHLIELSADWPEASEKLRTAFERSYYEGILQAAVGQRPALQGFERNQHEQVVKEFDKADQFLLTYNRARVKHSHLQGLPDMNLAGGNASQVKRQCELQRGHKPIRWALEKAGPLIQQMKPVFLMSPLSVAQFLPREDIRFDVVIFDEASQIKPEDALSAIVRANQTIVVGDSKQMPPTAFFDKLVGDFDDEEDEVQTVGQMESLLALVASIVRGTTRSTDLRWHYRSLHPSLIRPSNSAFYDNRLVVFPSPVLHGAEGLQLHYDSTDVYDRGGTRKNLKQAERIANAAIRHMKEHPKESLIVVAFSKQQEEAIEDAMELAFQSNPGLLSEHNSRHPFERFDVKNLESVQGDERDVVFISVGYGPDEKGFTTMSFGPINSKGGDRRLNVLMSRARKRCEVFSSIRSGDFRTTELSQPGVFLLKKFLHFAETGEFDDPRPTGREEDSIFEEQVAKALRRHGVEIDVQVGSIGFFIDMAVRHPDFPGRYVLGIECDGATYHSARSARDRDKLRQAALEARGWKLHRIWSTDWWQNPDAEVQRCLAAIQNAIDSFDKDAAVEEEEHEPDAWIDTDEFIIDVPPVITEAKKQKYQVWTRAFNLQGYSIQNLPTEAMAKCVHTILAYEGPLHKDVLIHRVRKSGNLGRAGSIVREAIESGIYAAERQKLIETRGEYCYPSGWECKYIRDVSDLASSDKKPDYTVPEELAFALKEIVGSSYGIEPGEAISRAWRFLGYSQCTEKMQSFGERVIADLKVAEHVRQDDRGNLLLAPTDA
ncbi:MAG: DUF3320 domain-containing protein [Fimbriimonadaceae bacterium]